MAITVDCETDLGLDVIELPPDENIPECIHIYVEDTAFVCNGVLRW